MGFLIAAHARLLREGVEPNPGMQEEAAMKGATTTPFRMDITSAERPPRSAYRIDASETPPPRFSWYERVVGMIWATPPARQHDHRGDEHNRHRDGDHHRRDGDDQHHPNGDERHHHNGEAPPATESDPPTSLLAALSLEETPSPDATQPCEESRQQAATENEHHNAPYRHHDPDAEEATPPVANVPRGVADKGGCYRETGRHKATAGRKEGPELRAEPEGAAGRRDSALTECLRPPTPRPSAAH